MLCCQLIHFVSNSSLSSGAGVSCVFLVLRVLALRVLAVVQFRPGFVFSLAPAQTIASKARQYLFKVSLVVV